MKYWQGKFNESMDTAFEQFVSTFSFDKRLYKHDVMGSIAHCTMLAEQGILSAEEAKLIQRALTQVFYDITSGKLPLENADDVYSFLDRETETRVGEIAKRLDIARTECDRAALDLRMYVIELCGDVSEHLKNLVEEITAIASNHLTAVIPSIYHGAKAQPTTLAHSLTANAEAFIRDIERLNDVKKRAAIMPLYSAYGTGTRYPINRRRVAELLKFSAVTQNSADALLDRDYAADFVYACATISRHIRTFASAIYDWCAAGYAKADSTLTGDSKVIPGGTELSVIESVSVRASKCAALPAVLESIDSRLATYTRSTYEIADTVFDAENSVKNCISVITAVIGKLTFDEAAMFKAANSGTSTALDCMDYLVDKGENADTARVIVGKICEYCAENNKRLDTLSPEIYAGFSPLFERDIISAMRPKTAVRMRKHEGEPSDVAVRAEIRAIGRKLARLFPDAK